MHSVKDGDRVYKFEGELLAHSSSRSDGKGRWVEFNLYRTARGGYVLSRTGVTLFYHFGACPVVRRNGLEPLPAEVLPTNSIPCPDCRPDLQADTLLYPEHPRYWAQVCETPEGVISSMRQRDAHGTAYLTEVSRRLLEQAAKADKGIHDAYYVEWIE